MIKKIPVKGLQVGMYIHDLNCSWSDHDFLRNHFLIKTEKQIEKILFINAHEIYIDTEKGIDFQDAPTIEQVVEEREQELIQTAIETQRKRPAIHREKTVPLKLELHRAVEIRREALKVAHKILGDVRLGKQADVAGMQPVVEKITQSVFRNVEALTTLSRIKNADDYTFEHCVSLCTLMASFSHSMGLDSDTIWDASVGGLFHDVGKMRVPDHILNKPGKLTEGEFAIMKTHVQLGLEVMNESNYTPPMVMQIVGEHHERCDGNGYPMRIGSTNISLLGKMASIVDVYDAITSNRVYHQAMAPHEAIRKLYEWSRFQFDRPLVEHFIRLVGIYPVGSVVNTTSDKAGIVVRHRPDDLLHPVLCIIYDHKRHLRIPPRHLDLADPETMSREESILQINEDIAAQLKINPMEYVL